MPTRNVTCQNCGCAGMLGVHQQSDFALKNHLFKHLGHNPYSGDLHYQCPACKIMLLVDPIAALGKISLKGFPGRSEDLLSIQYNNKSMGLEHSHSFGQEEMRA